MNEDERQLHKLLALAKRAYFDTKTGRYRATYFRVIEELISATIPDHRNSL